MDQCRQSTHIPLRWASNDQCNITQPPNTDNTSTYFNYRCQTGYVLAAICLFVGLSVIKITQNSYGLILMKFRKEVCLGTRNNQFNFQGDFDADLDKRILYFI